MNPDWNRFPGESKGHMEFTGLRSLDLPREIIPLLLIWLEVIRQFNMAINSKMTFFLVVLNFLTFDNCNLNLGTIVYLLKKAISESYVIIHQLEMVIPLFLSYRNNFA